MILKQYCNGSLDNSVNPVNSVKKSVLNFVPISSLKMHWDFSHF